MDITEHIGFVNYIVIKDFYGERWAYDDLVQEGIIGLLLAKRKYKDSKGAVTSFSSYYIRDHICKYLKLMKSPVKIPLKTKLRDIPVAEEFNEEYDVPFDTFEDKVCALLDRDRIRNVIDSVLSDRERQIVYLRYGFIDNECYTLTEIGKKFNLSKQRVSQILKQSLLKIKRRLNRLAFTY